MDFPYPVRYLVKGALFLPRCCLPLLIFLQHPFGEFIASLDALVDRGIDLVFLQSACFLDERLVPFPRPALHLREHAQDLIGIDDSQGVGLSGVGMMAAPGIVGRRFRDPGPDGIVVDVLEKREQVVLPVAEHGFISSLEEVPDSTVLRIEVCGIGLVDPLKDLRKRRRSGFDQDMDVVAHENIGIDRAMIAVLVDGEQLKIFLMISGRSEDPLSLVAAGNDVVERAFEFDPGLAGHEQRLAEAGNPVNT